MLAAAAELFAERGYPQVAMSDIAEAVAIGPSALYRHFRGKQELLHEVISTAFTALGVALETDLADGRAGLDTIAAAALEHRGVGVLWQREARHLEPERHEELRAELVAISGRLAAKISGTRVDLHNQQVDLLAWATLGSLISVSYHRVQLPRADYVRLLAQLGADVLATTFSAESGPAAASPSQVEPTSSTKDAVVSAAMQLFSQRGYHGTSVDDIGAVVGIAGPSIYHHFPSKPEVLLATIAEGERWLTDDLARTLAETTSPVEALNRVVRSFAEYALSHPDAMDVLIAETDALPSSEQRRVRKVQRDYINAWVDLLRDLHRLDNGPARIRVQAAFTVINDVARTPHLRGAPDIGPAVVAIASSILGLTVQAPVE
ncbi:TetR/AcrR family transcriptional regulator [Luteipulveratus mongoliensis]|uniref:TetR/AcrR family transcriptional regulator n=1 Tax=Luteipulveratus mongoliensis TaxID=571913 RepID=UPI00247FD89F|nr:TetR/AcrR family transcriptional regulator [Luteipulveratus mongoliensis]